MLFLIVFLLGLLAGGKSSILSILSKRTTLLSLYCVWCYKSEVSSLAADLAVD